MKNPVKFVLLFLGAALTLTLAACELTDITSASPDTSAIIEASEGQALTFEVIGPQATAYTRCRWNVTRLKSEGVEVNTAVATGNTFTYTVPATGEGTNKIWITCESQRSYNSVYITEDSRTWTIRTKQDQPYVYEGAYDLITLSEQIDQIMRELAAVYKKAILDPGQGDPPYGVEGPYGYERIKDTGLNNDYDIFIPATFNEDTFTHPIINWANGAISDVDPYNGLLATWATWGFVVVAGHTNDTEDGVSLNEGCDWIVEQNSNPESRYYNKLDVNAIGASGHSLGGGSVVVAAGTASLDKPHISVTVPIMPAGVGTGEAPIQTGPMLILTDRYDLASWGHLNALYQLSNVPTMLLMWYGYHEDVQSSTTARNPSTAWFRLHLMQSRDGYDDSAAQALFYGDDCLYCQSTEFEIWKKNITE